MGRYGGCRTRRPLRHSVEEIVESCRDAQQLDGVRSELASSILHRLGLSGEDLSSPGRRLSGSPWMSSLTCMTWCSSRCTAAREEDGTLQEVLNRHGVRYNGSDVAASRLCMDKYETGKDHR